MDSIFHLNAEARGRSLQTVARTLRCSYICLWSYLPQPSNCLVSTGGWFNEDEGSSSAGSLAQRLFNAYRGSFCSIGDSTVPGLAYKEGLPYLELGDSDLMNVSSMRIQRQFYQEAGIKTAVFMGCNSGEIELGMSAPSNINWQKDISNLFGEDFIQQSQLGELIPPDQSRLSSSPSSLRSFSMSSPEYPSLLLSKASTSFVPEALREITRDQATQSTPTLVSPHQMTMQSYSQYPAVQFPTPASDDAAFTRATLAVMSASSSSSMAYQSPQHGRMHRLVGVFTPYNSALAPRPFEPKPRFRNQKMMKTSISILRRINWLRGEGRTQDSQATSSRLYHNMAERKRREKLNKGFQELRSLLPPGTKKDRTSILADVKDYLNALKTQISELEEKNKMLEAQIPSTDETEEEGDSSKRVSVQIIRAAESLSSALRISLRITVRVDCNIIDLTLRVLECIKEMKDINMISADANTCPAETNVFARVVLMLQIKESNWDEESFKEAMMRAVDGVVARPETGPS